jgi:hypothetical protein
LLGACEFLEHMKAAGYDPKAVNDLAAGRTLFSDYAVAQFQTIDAAFADLETLLAADLDPGTREGLAAIRDDLAFWRLFQFQTAWLLRQRKLTMALDAETGSGVPSRNGPEGASQRRLSTTTPDVTASLRRELDDWNRVLAGWVVDGRLDLQPAADIPDDVVRRLVRATAQDAGKTVGTSFLDQLADSRDLIVHGYLRLPDGSMHVPAVWMTLDGSAAGEGYFLDGEFIKIGPPGVFSIAGGTRGTARWTFPGKPGRYAITVYYMDDKDDRGQPGAKSVLSVDGKPVLQWDYTIGDDGIHTVRCEADLEFGSLIRIDSQTEPDVKIAAEYCRIKGLTFTRVE